MPLEPGCSDEVISRNVAELIRSGKDKDQAVAIAHANCRGKAFIAPRPLSLVERLTHRKRREGMTILKGADGLRYMVIVTSNSYKDRENEYITTKALARYVERAWIADDVCETGNEHLFWHGGDPIGDIVWTDMEGPFLVEVSKERPDKVINLALEGEEPRLSTVKAIWDYLETNPDNWQWGASHGFKFEEKRINFTRGEATYDEIEKFETSTLPLEDAANPYTFSGVIDMADRNEVLDKILGQQGAADKLRKGVQTMEQRLAAQGVEHKAVDATPGADATETKVKALLDTLSAKADGFLGGLMDSPPAGLKEAIVKLILSAVGEAPTEEPATPDAAMADGAAPADEAMMGKQVKLLDALIETQTGLFDEIKALRENYARLTPLDTLAEALKGLRGEIAALKTEQQTVKAQLAGRPRSASRAAETIEDDPQLLDKVKNQLQPVDTFWGGNGAAKARE